MSSNSITQVYSINGYMVSVGNRKAYERGTGELRAFISKFDKKQGGNTVIESFSGSHAELDAINRANALASIATVKTSFWKRLFKRN